MKHRYEIQTLQQGEWKPMFNFIGLPHEPPRTSAYSTREEAWTEVETWYGKLEDADLSSVRVVDLEASE